MGVIFPDTAQLPRIRAEHALEETSRGALWSFTPTAHRPRQLYACSAKRGSQSQAKFSAPTMPALVVEPRQR